MNAPDLVQELGSRLNLTGLSLTDGVCRLVFDRQLPIDIEDDGSGNLAFHAVIGVLPHGERERVLRTLMSSHLFGLETAGAAFGLHPGTDDVYLFRLLPVESLEVEQALRVLESFTHQVEAWKRRWPELSQAAPRVESRPEADFAGSGLRA
ncbi:MAG: type III secretion system chaperone [Opitutaceae bacterium]|nr:type III secretion system chaperone [Opitutaceae bacterium]